MNLSARGVVRRRHWTDGPTLLADAELHGHTDLDVLEDLEATGLVYLDGGMRRLTVEGSVIRTELATHLAMGGNYANFDVRATVRTALNVA